VSFLYLTADKIGLPTGGGQVTYHECQALKELSNNPAYLRGFAVRDREHLSCDEPEPWGWDNCFEKELRTLSFDVDLAHIYSGTFSKTVKRLKEYGCKVSYTVAAHNIDLSRREHHRWGMPFPYPHLNEPKLWMQYSEGYLLADVIICPSTHSAEIVRNYPGRNPNQPIVIIPHGVDIPEKTKPFPKQFTVGYLGAIGPDKGIIYLLQAWKKLNYKDAVLVLAGRDSISEFTQKVLLPKFGGGCIVCTGWVKDVADFYGSISLLIQPSVTEGFGLEVLEAMAYGRPAIMSRGVGAAGVLPEWMTFESANVDSLCWSIEHIKQNWDKVGSEEGRLARRTAELYKWDKIRAKYIEVWKGLLQ